MSKIQNALITFLNSKYLLVLAAFVIWIFFFDNYNVLSHANYHSQIEQLEKDKVFYQSGITEVDMQAGKLNADPATLERYAREKFHMKRNNEDVFVVDEK